MKPSRVIDVGKSMASMRPRHRCRGRLRHRRHALDVFFGFNEAAASMPRKIVDHVQRVEQGRSGFNEAAASMPRKMLSNWHAKRAPAYGLQ